MNIRNLQVGDIVAAKTAYSDRGIEFFVVKNNLNDVLFLWSEYKQKGHHTFYDNEVDLKFAKFKFDLEV